VLVEVDRADGRVDVRIEDPAPTGAVDDLRGALADDAERLAALGGELELGGGAAGGPVTVRVRMPDRLEPVVESAVVESAVVPNAAGVRPGASSWR
jgi:hypothetical protein